MKPSVIILAVTLLLSACNNKNHSPDYCPQTVHCTKEKTGLIFQGYTSPELDSIITTSYTKGDSFLHVESVRTYALSSNTMALTADFDYDIYILKTATHHRISHIVQPQDSSFIYTACAGGGKPRPAPECSFSAISAIVDGQTQKPISSGGGMYSFVVKK